MQIRLVSAAPLLLIAALSGCGATTLAVQPADTSAPALPSTQASTGDPGENRRSSYLEVENRTGEQFLIYRQVGEKKVWVDGSPRFVWDPDGELPNGTTRKFWGYCSVCVADISLDFRNDVWETRSNFVVRADNPTIASKWVSVSNNGVFWNQPNNVFGRDTLDDGHWTYERFQYRFEFQDLGDSDSEKRTHLTITKK